MAAEKVGGRKRKQLLSRDSLRTGEQSGLRHCRDNNLGVSLSMGRGRGVLGAGLWMRNSSTPPSSSFFPSQGLAADGPEAWERPGTLPAAHGGLLSSCHHHPTPGRRLRGQMGVGERWRAGVISLSPALPCPAADRFCQSRRAAPVPARGSPGRSSSPGASWI